MELAKVSQVLAANKNRIIEARKILDSATTLSLIGASVDKQSRERIVVGTSLVTTGTIALGAIGLTGLAGPVILGLAVAPVAAKLTIFTGIGMMLSGFIRGFRAGMDQVEKSNEMASKVAAALEEHGVSIKNIDFAALLGNSLIKVS